MKYKYVKFSRGTARKNPQMIVKEYDTIIRKLADEIYPYFKDKKHLLHIIPLGIYINWETTSREFQMIELSFDELEHLYINAKIEANSKLEKRTILHEMQEELRLFKNKYM